MTPLKEITDPGSLKTQIAVLHSMLQRLTDEVERVIKILDGNGKPGLCARVHVNESKINGLMFVAGCVVTCLIGWIVKGWVGQ